MALKFLNKKGWHTGSLRNIENVWKAEQKHDAEQRKLEELRKQIQDERERAEFRQLQEQAGLVPRQERLDFLYESGLAVGKGSSEVFKALQGPPGAVEASASHVAAAVAAGGASSSKVVVPGALFEDKPQSANDAWRKLHTDPLLLIRQKEQDALSRIKSNPVQMAMIRKSVEVEKKQKEHDKKEKRHKKKHHHSKSKHRRHSRRSDSSDEGSSEETVRRKRERSPSERLMEHQQRDKQILDADHRYKGKLQASEDMRKHTYENSEEIMNRKRAHSPSERHIEHQQRDRRSSDSRHRLKGKSQESEDMRRQNYHNSEETMRRKRELSPSLHHAERKKHDKQSEHNRGSGSTRQETNDKHLGSDNRGSGSTRQETNDNHPSSAAYQGPGYNNRRMAPKLSQEEREARLREMELDAELHEEQRWKRLKKASEREAEEAEKDKTTGGRNFLDAAQKSIYGTAKGGSSTIEESVRRRTFYSQGGSAAEEKNAFRR